MSTDRAQPTNALALAGVATQKAVLGGGRVQARTPVARASRPRVVACRAAGLSGKVKKVVLAYSGGLDTSVILKWLQDTYDCEVGEVVLAAACAVCRLSTVATDQV